MSTVFKKFIFRIQLSQLIASFLLLLALIGSYDLIKVTFINFNATSGLGAVTYYTPLWNLQRTKDHYRFISAGYMTTIPTFYGLDTFDGFLHNSSFRRNYFIAYGLYDPAVDKLHTHSHFFYEFPKGFDVNLFKLANVKYVVSDKAIQHPSLHLIAYSNPVYANNIHYHFKTYLHAFFKKTRLVDPLYVYQLKNVWPRIFIARQIKLSSYSLREKFFYQELKKNPFGSILLAKEDQSLIIKKWSTDTSIKILGYRLNTKGAVINLSHGGGVVVFNEVITPSWHAFCNEQPLPLLAVNGIMMAASVPKQCKTLLLKYQL